MHWEQLIYNGNWTEWSAIWAEIIRVIWNHKYDFRPKLHDTRFNYHFITSILKFSNEGLGQFKYFVDAVPDWAGLKIHPSFGGKK